MKRLRCLFPLLFQALCLAAAQTEPAASTRSAAIPAHYGYVLDCGADLTKLDLIAKSVLSTVSPASKTGLIHLTGDTGASSFDGCATYGLAFTPGSQTLYTLAPETGSYRLGGRRFRLLAFHLPDLALLRSVPLPLLVAEGDEPWLRPQTDAGGAVLVRLNPRAALLLSGGKFSSVPLPDRPRLPGSIADSSTPGYLTLEPTGYRLLPSSNQLPNHSVSCLPQQQSGDATLLRFEGANGPEFAVVHTRSKTLVALTPAFRTTDESYHLAPNGAAVLVQETATTLSTGLSVMGSNVVLMDATNGALLRHWNQPTLARSRLAAISPSGLAIFEGRQGFSFLVTGLNATSEPVVSLGPRTTATVDIIFADPR